MTEQKNKMNPEHPDCPFVTKIMCNSRTRISKWAIGIFLGMITVFVTLVVYAASEATDANAGYIDMSGQFSEHKQEVQNDVSNVKSDLATHQAAQRVSERTIADKLDEIKIELMEQRKEQRVLLEQILKIQVKIAGEHP